MEADHKIQHPCNKGSSALGILAVGLTAQAFGTKKSKEATPATDQWPSSSLPNGIPTNNNAFQNEGTKLKLKRTTEHDKITGETPNGDTQKQKRQKSQMPLMTRTVSKQQHATASTTRTKKRKTT